MHHKFMIIDGKMVINGSMNFTWYGMHKNHENIMVVKNTQIAQFFCNEFESLWNAGNDLTGNQLTP